MKVKSEQRYSIKSLRPLLKGILALNGTVLSYHISGPVRDRFTGELSELPESDVFIPEDGQLGYQYVKIQSVSTDEEGNEITVLREYSTTDNSRVWFTAEIPTLRRP